MRGCAALLSLLFVASLVFAQTPPLIQLDREAFVVAALQQDPRLQETRMKLLAKELQVEQVKMSALLPKFEFYMLMGPAPGLKTRTDRCFQDIVCDTTKTWDWTTYGPFVGTRLQLAQPLNYGQLRKGLKAARADLKQTQKDIEGKELDKRVELESYYYGYLLAREMQKLANDANKQIHKAADQLEEALDDEQEGVTQMDLLGVKAMFFTVEQNVAEANASMSKVKLALQFALNLPEGVEFAPADSALAERQDAVPSLDSLQNYARSQHPDIQRLAAGLDATGAQMDLAAAKLGPEFFITGEVEYAKSWAAERSSVNPNAFAQDPVNKISGAFGIGVRYKLNFWSTWENYKAARVAYRTLRHTESYAARGIALQVQEKYIDYQAAKEKLASARTSLRATQGMLKGAAMQYELAPEKSTKLLVDAYSKNVYMEKDYYYAVYNYNLAVARLFAEAGYR